MNSPEIAWLKRTSATSPTTSVNSSEMTQHPTFQWTFNKPSKSARNTAPNTTRRSRTASLTSPRSWLTLPLQDHRRHPQLTHPTLQLRRQSPTLSRGQRLNLPLQSGLAGNARVSNLHLFHTHTLLQPLGHPTSNPTKFPSHLSTRLPRPPGIICEQHEKIIHPPHPRSDHPPRNCRHIAAANTRPLPDATGHQRPPHRLRHHHRPSLVIICHPHKLRLAKPPLARRDTPQLRHPKINYDLGLTCLYKSTTVAAEINN